MSRMRVVPGRPLAFTHVTERGGRLYGLTAGGDLYEEREGLWKLLPAYESVEVPICGERAPWSSVEEREFHCVHPPDHDGDHIDRYDSMWQRTP